MFNFHVGQKVICIDVEEYDAIEGMEFMLIKEELELYKVYTIRWVGEFHYETLPNPDYIGIRLVEVDRANGEWKNEHEVPFHSKRFRPIIKTDISIFEAMLNPTSKKKKENA